MQPKCYVVFGVIGLKTGRTFTAAVPSHEIWSLFCVMPVPGLKIISADLPLNLP